MVEPPIRGHHGTRKSTLQKCALKRGVPYGRFKVYFVCGWNHECFHIGEVSVSEGYMQCILSASTLNWNLLSWLITITKTLIEVINNNQERICLNVAGGGFQQFPAYTSMGLQYYKLLSVAAIIMVSTKPNHCSCSYLLTLLVTIVIHNTLLSWLFTVEP